MKSSFLLSVIIFSIFLSERYKLAASPTAPAAVLAALLGTSVAASGAAVAAARIAPSRPFPPVWGVLVAGSSSTLRRRQLPREPERRWARPWQRRRCRLPFRRLLFSGITIYLKSAFLSWDNPLFRQVETVNGTPKPSQAHARISKTFSLPCWNIKNLLSLILEYRKPCDAHARISKTFSRSWQNIENLLTLMLEYRKPSNAHARISKPF